MNGEHETIWLQPWCDGCQFHCRGGDDGRQWCQDDVWGKCDECDRPSVRYVLAPPAPAKRFDDGTKRRHRGKT